MENLKFTQADRDSAITLIECLHGKCSNGERYLYLDGSLDDSFEVKILASHRIQACVELVEALWDILLYADPEGMEVYNGANDIVGVKGNGEIVLKGSFITTCIRARAILANHKETEA